MSQQTHASLASAFVPDIAGIAIKPGRISRAKAADTTRRVDLGVAELILTGDIAPKAGDLVLAQIERLVQHKRIELVSGHRVHLHIGLGERHAQYSDIRYFKPSSDRADDADDNR